MPTGSSDVNQLHVRFNTHRYTRLGLSARIALLTAATLVVTLLLCPAVNRVIRQQRLDQNPVSSTTYTPSFQRSLHVPPEPHVVLPDVQIVLLLIADPQQPAMARWQRPIDEAVPRDPLLSSPRSLRAPPAARS
jgi:hypothetical protein